MHDGGIEGENLYKKVSLYKKVAPFLRQIFCHKKVEFIFCLNTCAFLKLLSLLN